MKAKSVSFYWRAWLLLALTCVAQLAGAQIVLDNSRLRFGTGQENSVNANGNLRQPFYYDSATAQLYQLTFSNYPLDNAIGIGGTGASEWNTEGTVVENPALTNQVVDTSAYVPLSPNTGYGTLVSTGTITIGGSALELRNTYELGEEVSFVKITTRLTNTSASSVNNVRVWVGTRDDFVGSSDQPTKRRGNIGTGSFVAIPNAATRAAALQITSGDQGVLFYSTSPKAYTTVNQCCQFSRAWQQNPATAAIEVTNDGSYALFVRMDDLAVGASEEFTWYYAAGAVSELNDIVGDVAGEQSGIRVTTTSGVGGGMTPSSRGVVSGAIARFTVTPDVGYHVGTAQGCGGSLSGDTFTTGAVTASCDISASFIINTYTVTATAATGGAITPSTTATHGQSASLTLAPEPGFAVDAITGCGGGGSLVGNVYTTGPITADCAVNATFRAAYTVTATAVGGGAVSAASVVVPTGDATSITVMPNAGFSIGEVSGCGGTLSGDVYSIPSVTAACEVVANFMLTAPTFQVTPPAVFSMNSTELLTPLPATAAPRAVDFQGTDVPVTLVTASQSRFAPGRYELTYRAVDARGAIGDIQQTLLVYPTVNLGPDLSIGARAGNFASFRIALNGLAPEYPFTVNYTVSGDTQGTTLESGAVVFANNEVEKEIPFAVQATSPAGAAERTAQVTLDEQLNRGSTRALSITLTTINQPPLVNLQLSQSGEDRVVLGRDAGPVTFSALINDPDTSDTHTVEWRAPSGATFTVDGSDIIVTPASLSPGVHRFELIVTDSGAPPTITRRTFDVVVLDALPVLPAGVTRLLPNGLPDSSDYAPVAPNVLPERGGELSHHLMEADAGTRLSLGPYARYRNAFQTELPGTPSAFQIPNDSITNLGGYFDFVVDDLPRAGESVSVVVPQRAAIPELPIYRKYDPTTNQWRTFFEDNDNRLASAPGAEGYCPPTLSSDYRAGLNPGDWCVRLTIKDGGANDADGAVNGSVSDPGGIGALSNVSVTGKSGGGSFDLWLLLGAMFLLLLKAGRRHQALMAAALMSVVATQANAQQAEDSSAWYVGGQFGSARSNVSAYDIDTALQGQGYNVATDVSDRSRDAWRAYGGYQIFRWLSVEAGYSDLGEVKLGFVGPVVDIGQFLIAANAQQPPSAEGYDAAVVARFFFTENAAVYARAGGFFWDARYRTRNVDGQSVRRKDDGSDGLASIGAAVNISRRWSLHAEFTRYGIDGDHIDFAGVGANFRW